MLAGTTATNTGPSVIGGDVGVSPGTALTGFGSAAVTGTQHSADGVADQAQADLTTAYTSAAGQVSSATVSADLGGQTLAPGVYSGPSLSLTGTLTLDAGNDANAVFVFQAGSTLTTASASVVTLLHGASPCNVYWQVGSSATLGTSSSFTGSVLALTSISATTVTAVTGRLLARNGATTLDDTTITVPTCTAPVPPASPPATSPAPTTSASSTPSPSGTASPTSTPLASASATASASPTAASTPTASPGVGAPASPSPPRPSPPRPSPPRPSPPTATRAPVLAPGTTALPTAPLPGGPVRSRGGTSISTVGVSGPQVSTPRTTLPLTGAPIAYSPSPGRLPWRAAC